MTEQPTPEESTPEPQVSDLPEGFDPRCLHCEAHNDSVTEVQSEGRRPEPGALMLCLYCGYICVFGETSFVRPDEMLLDAALHQEDIMQAIFARGVMAARGQIPAVHPSAPQPHGN